MIATLPRAVAAPAEYRYALDAVMPLLSPAGGAQIICNAASFRAEVAQRLPDVDYPGSAAGLWVEPLVNSWVEDLETFTACLLPGAPLVIIASQPLVRLMPGRRDWHVSGLGSRPAGLRALQHGLIKAGFISCQCYGVRTVHSTFMGLLGQVAENCGRADWNDQLQFASRRHYCSAGVLGSLATVRLIIARKGPH